ncbi:hypothetical protein TNCV_238291 [Trichonephila clavipes]|nr:hypothetical protein TNCV_238291 [Trichonephila clavipes]
MGPLPIYYTVKGKQSYERFVDIPLCCKHRMMRNRLNVLWYGSCRDPSCQAHNPQRHRGSASGRRSPTHPMLTDPHQSHLVSFNTLTHFSEGKSASPIAYYSSSVKSRNLVKRHSVCSTGYR